MERLTERLENGAINVKYASQHETAIHRLVTIEDILGDEYDLSRLRELVQADRDGRCVVLPAKIGDSIYFTFLGKIIEKQVFSVVTFYKEFIAMEQVNFSVRMTLKKPYS